MILINETSVIGEVTKEKYSSTIKITNYEQCSIEFLDFISKLAFVINTTSFYPDMVVVISNDNLDEFVYELARNASFCKIEQGK